MYIYAFSRAATDKHCLAQCHSVPSVSVGLVTLVNAQPCDCELRLCRLSI